jgi:hypothetical protein
MHQSHRRGPSPADLPSIAAKILKSPKDDLKSQGSERDANRSSHARAHALELLAGL